jgi:hypothetical protein
MRRTILRSLPLPLLLAAALLVPTGSANNARVANQAAAREATCLAERAARVDQLVADATSVEYGKLEQGRRVNVYHHRATGAGARQQDTLGPVTLVHAGGQHGAISAYSDYWEWKVSEGGNGRKYQYYTDVWIKHWLSDPCSGSDAFAYGANVGCLRYYPPTNTTASNPCDFRTWVGLEAAPYSSGNYAPEWGLNYLTATNKRSCTDGGGQHGLGDNSGFWVRTWLRMEVDFKTEALAHITASFPRKTTSKEMVTGATHAYEFGPCWPDWCSSPSVPSAGGPYGFDSCVA